MYRKFNRIVYTRSLRYSLSARRLWCMLAHFKKATVDARGTIRPRQINAANRIANGTHHFLKRPDGSSLGKDSVLRQTENGTNAFSGGEVQRKSNAKRVREGTHHFLSGDIQRRTQQRLVENGTHHLMGNGEFQRNVQKTLLENGTHHFLTNHPNKIQVTCPHCNKTGGKTNMHRYHFDKCRVLK